jgi:hypothetical protein
MGEVYVAVCRLNGKCYVGLTTRTMEDRMLEHLTLANDGGGYSFHQAIREHGWANFGWSVLKRTDDPNELARWEMHYIRTLRARYPAGYNHTVGGELPAKLRGTFQPQIPDQGFVRNLFADIAYALRRSQDTLHHHREEQRSRYRSG